MSTNMESCLLGITLAVLILFDELIEIETDPKASEPSSNAIKQPFWKKDTLHKRSYRFEI